MEASFSVLSDMRFEMQMRDILLFLKRSFSDGKEKPSLNKDRMERVWGNYEQKKIYFHSCLRERQHTQKNDLFIRKFNKTNGERKVRDDRIRTRERT